MLINLVNKLSNTQKGFYDIVQQYGHNNMDKAKLKLSERQRRKTSFFEQGMASVMAKQFNLHDLGGQNNINNE